MVSVIIPNYNHSAFLKERIQSVLNQTYSDFELIILDDCSSDKSRDIIESFRSNPKVSHIIYNDRNSGSTFRQWNKRQAKQSEFLSSRKTWLKQVHSISFSTSLAWPIW